MRNSFVEMDKGSKKSSVKSKKREKVKIKASEADDKMKISQVATPSVKRLKGKKNIISKKHLKKVLKKVTEAGEDVTSERVATKKKTFNKPAPKDAALEERTIFVGNLPLSVNKKQIRKLFRRFGTIEAIRFRSAPVRDHSMAKKVAFITKDMNPDRHNMNGYVRFSTVEEAKSALSANGDNIDGLTVCVDMAGGTKKRPRNKAVFVGNLAFEVEEEELREEFSSCGDIESIHIIRDQLTCLGKGFGYVNFRSTDAVHLALEMDGRPIRGRPVRVKPYVKKAKDDQSFSRSGKNNKFNSKNNKSLSKKGSNMDKKSFRKNNFGNKNDMGFNKSKFKDGKKKKFANKNKFKGKKNKKMFSDNASFMGQKSTPGIKTKLK